MSSDSRPSSSSKSLLFVGSLNRAMPNFRSANGNGLSMFEFDEESLAARQIANVPEIINPTFLSVDGENSRLYATSEIHDWKEGLVTAYSFDRTAGSLDYINMQPTLGSASAHNAVAGGLGRLFVGNYGAGLDGPDQSVVVFDIRRDGGLAPARSSVRNQGTGPVIDRQERSHTHSVTPLGRHHLLVADLGLDRLFLYTVENDGGLVLSSATATEPGAGPRHVCVHPASPLVFVVNELNSTVASYAFDAGKGSLRQIAVCSTLLADNDGKNFPADLQISPDGLFLYASNRGDDSIVTLSVDPDSGALAAVDTIPCGGQTPRNLALTASGRILLCANQDADHIAVFSRDLGSGRLTDSGYRLATGTPMCLRLIA